MKKIRAYLLIALLFGASVGGSLFVWDQNTVDFPVEESTEQK